MNLCGRILQRVRNGVTNSLQIVGEEKTALVLSVL